ncbi:MAG: hypothetical protein IID41_02205 [Planctomycetes bacterium]|nr:hypothetical protein [Planctomycetota bacterium]
MIQKVEPKQMEMPPVFLEWQCEERRAMFAALRRGEMPRFLASHLPAVSTLNSRQGAFPIHSSTKGVGLLPKECHLAEHVTEITDCLARGQDEDHSKSLTERIEATLSLYDRPARIDTGVFGGIEIFRRQTYDNLLADPRAALLFTGFGPQYLSFQFNCDVEVVEPGDPRFDFLRGMRLLFEQERFHIQQPEHSLGYVFHIREVLDKTPRALAEPPEPHSAGGCPHSAR